MDDPKPEVVPQARPHKTSLSSSLLRQLVEGLVLCACVLLLVRTLGVEPYEVPTGSMAPALLGHHRTTTCPQCGYSVRVGLVDPSPGSPEGKPMSAATCPNCGCGDLQLDRQPISTGEHLLVNKYLYDVRRPRRWEMAVFQSPILPSRTFVKRVVGLPGELVQIRQGDVYIDHEISRKTLAEARAMRIPVFDVTRVPQPDGWGVRWETRPDHGVAFLQGNQLRLPALDAPEEYQWLVYRHTLGTSDKIRPVFDEYGYNGAAPGPRKRSMTS